MSSKQSATLTENDKAPSVAPQEEQDVFVLPATAAQQWVWQLDRLDPGNPACNIAIRFQLDGPLSPERVREAFATIINRHEALRTTFSLEGDELKQIVAPTSPVDLIPIDLRALSNEQRAQRAEELAVETARERFDLSQGPLLRIRLVQLQDAEHRLLVTLHHIVGDGWSTGVLLREFATLYEALTRGESPVRNPLPLQFGDYAIWQEQQRAMGFGGQLAFWRKKLAELPVLDLPTDRPRPRMQSFPGEIETRLLPQSLTEQIENVAYREHVTPFMFLLSALEVLLQRRSGQDDFPIGSILAGRSREDLEPLIGLFVNSVVLRADLAGDPTFRELLDRVRETTFQALDHQDIPFAVIAEELVKERDPSRYPLFQVNFLYQKAFLTAKRLGPLEITPIPSVSPGSLYDLNFFLVERPEGLRLSCEYNSDLFQSETIQGMLLEYQSILETAASQLSTPLSKLRSPAVPDSLPPETSAPSPVPRPKETTAFPLTEPQMEIFLSARQNAEASAAYNEGIRLDLRGDFNRPALHQAISRLIERHEALRASFDPDGEFFTIGPPREVLLQETNLLDIDSKSQAQRLREFIRDEAALPFDLQTGPLIRFHLVQFAPEHHVLLVTAHHIVCDGWSFGVLIQELRELAVHPNANLPQPPAFGEYALAEARWRKSPEFEAIETWWLDRFQTPVEPLELPLDHPRGTEKSFRGDTVRRVLEGELYRRLKAWGAKNGCTLFVTLFSGFAALIQRLTHQEEFVIGIPAAGQSLLEESNLVGHCVNFLPIRMAVAGSSDIKTLLANVRETLLDAFDHQHYTLGSLMRKLRLPRNASRHPLVELQFNLDQIGGDQAAEGLQISMDACPKRFVNFDLFLNAVETGTGITLDCDYNADLFDRATIERWLLLYERILKGMLESAEQSISELDSISPDEKDLVIRKWNDTGRPAPRPLCVHQLFELQAAKTPEAIAVVCADQQLTYQQLNQRANQIAHHLRTRGAGQDALIGLCLERNLDLVSGMLGILKSGAAYVPFDADEPAERLTQILGDAGVSLILTQKHLASRLPEGPWQSIGLDDDPLFAGQADRSNLDSAQQTPEQLAYVMFTSGSTGRPKGVAIPHRGISRLVLDCNYVELDASTCIAQLASVSFDASTFEIWAPLLNGGRCVLYPHRFPDPTELETLIRSQGVNTLWLTSSLFNAILDERPQALQSIRQLLTGGEALSVPHIHKALKLLPDTQLINGYGPTENTTFTCCWAIPKDFSDQSASVPIGRPISQTRVYILDPNLRPVPIGVSGELCIGGEGLARGYLNEPELTRQRFVPNPFDEDPSSRLYRSGDICRWRADGLIEFLGRWDHQVKLRGFRIELGEIESALNQLAEISQSVVCVKPDATGEKQLVAYCLPADAKDFSVSTVRAQLSQRLPDYMLPAAWVVLEELPLTARGKIDRARLPDPEIARETEVSGFVAPRTAIENQLAGIWSDVLGYEPVGIRDNFYAQGGHSLLAMRLLAQIERQTGITIRFPDFLTNPTIENVAHRVSEPHEPTAFAKWIRLETPTEQNDRPGLLIMPDVIGHVHRWQEMFAQVDFDRPVFGLELTGNTPYWKDNPSIKDIAEKLGEVVLQNAGEKPLHVIGHSFGGYLAYELGQHLRQQGHPPLSVTLVDITISPAQREFQLRDYLSMARNVGPWFLNELAIYGFRDLLDRAQRRWSSRQKSQRRADTAQSTSDDANWVNRFAEKIYKVDDLPAFYQQRLYQSLSAVRNYQFRPTENQLINLHSQIRKLIHRSRRPADWNRVAPPERVRHALIPGDHGNPLHPKWWSRFTTVLKTSLNEVEDTLAQDK